MIISNSPLAKWDPMMLSEFILQKKCCCTVNIGGNSIWARPILAELPLKFKKKANVQSDAAVELQTISWPEALFAQSQSEGSRLVLLPSHHRRHSLFIFHKHGHLAVPAAQHAAVVDVGRPWETGEWTASKHQSGKNWRHKAELWEWRNDPEYIVSAAVCLVIPTSSWISPAYHIKF